MSFFQPSGAGYYVNLVDPRTKAFSTEPLPCDNDEEAIRRARDLAGPFHVELWDGNRIIGSFPATGRRANKLETGGVQTP